jgi:iron(III) transport system permease protein
VARPVESGASFPDLIGMRIALRPASVLPAIVAALVAIPIAGLFTHLLIGDAGTTWAHLVETGLGAYAATSGWLALYVVAGVVLVGATCGWLIAGYRFPGSRAFGFLLVLPLAMPSYVIAYAYTDLLQFSGPVQTWLRTEWGLRPRQYWFPEIRSVGGAAFVFVMVLFPYVYLPARAAFGNLPRSLVDAARSSGATPFEVFRRVVLPLAWPAIAAGALLTVMETMADFGAVSHFAVDTFTVGIYKAWLGYGDRSAAVQLALVLLVLVMVVLAGERALRGRRRFATRNERAAPRDPEPLRGAAAWGASLVCALPVLLGFVVPVAVLGRLAWREGEVHAWGRYVDAAQTTFATSAAAALIVMTVALALAASARLAGGRWIPRLVRFAALGYAVPGAVLAIGILIPLARFDNWLDAWTERAFAIDLGLLLTGSVTALLYAYLVRFLAIGLNLSEAGYQRITPSMDDAARALGVGGWRLAWRVHAPLLRGPMLVGGLLVFVDALKELPATIALRPFDFHTLATQAYDLARDERLGEAAVPSLAIVAVAILPALLASRALGRR